MTLKSSKTNISSNRIYYMDILRVIACLCVVMIHTCGSFVTKEYGSVNYWIGNVLDSISRVAVPLFIMISGALLLDENYDYSVGKIKKHIKKMILFFVFWSVVYCLVYEVW